MINKSAFVWFAVPAVAITLFMAKPAEAINEPFQVSMTLLERIFISEDQALSFPAMTSGPDALPVTVAPGDATAAIFSATGAATTGATASMAAASILMTDGLGDSITVDTFTMGGSLSGAGAGTFDGAGDITNMRVGATAQVTTGVAAGLYTGTATFSLVYQ